VSGFARDVEHLCRFGLHPESHFVLRDTCQRFRIAVLARRALVHAIENIEHRAPLLAADVAGIAQIEDRFARGAAFDALVHAGQETRTPQRLAGVGRVLSRLEHDEARQILVLRAQSISDPRSDRRTAEPGVAGLHRELRGRVIELIGSHRAHEAQLVDVFGDVWNAIRHPRPALPHLLEWILRSQHLGYAADEREVLSLEERLRAILAVLFRELGLVVEHLEVAGSAGHVNVDHAARARRDLRRQRRQRRGRIAPEIEAAPGRERRRQTTEEHRPQPGAALAQEMPALQIHERRFGESF
jgi:hypothetical protein